MHAPWRRRVAAAARLAAPCLIGASVLLLAGGCEKDIEKGDRDVEAKVATVNTTSQKPQELKDAINALKQAANVPHASPLAQIDAKSRLAQAEINAGDALMRQVQASEVEAGRITGEIQSLGEQPRAANIVIAGDEKLPPTAVT